MPETPNETGSMFPTLDDAQIGRLASLGAQRHVQPCEIIFDQGAEGHGVFIVFIVLKGSIELIGISNRVETALKVLG